MSGDELIRIKDLVLITVAEQMGVDPFDLRESDRKRSDLTIDAVLPLIEADVRERIATEIEAIEVPWAVSRATDPVAGWSAATRRCASIARGLDQ